MKYKYSLILGSIAFILSVIVFFWSSSIVGYILKVLFVSGYFFLLGLSIDKKKRIWLVVIIGVIIALLILFFILTFGFKHTAECFPFVYKNVFTGECELKCGGLSSKHPIWYWKHVPDDQDCFDEAVEKACNNDPECIKKAKEERMIMHFRIQ